MSNHKLLHQTKWKNPFVFKGLPFEQPYYVFRNVGLVTVSVPRVGRRIVVDARTVVYPCLRHVTVIAVSPVQTAVWIHAVPKIR